jgi:hypothetical protein
VPAHTALVMDCNAVIHRYALLLASADSGQNSGQKSGQNIEKLQAQVEAAEKEGNFELMGALGEQLEGLKLMSAQQPSGRLFSYEYDQLLMRRDVLVKRGTAKCKELAAAKSYAEMRVLGAKLAELKALDMEALRRILYPAAANDDEGENDPVCVDSTSGGAVSTGTSTTTGNGSQEDDNDGANDPVHVPTREVTNASRATTAISATAKEAEDDGANDPVCVSGETDESTLA